MDAESKAPREQIDTMVQKEMNEPEMNEPNQMVTGTLTGHIELLRAGVLSGWAASKSSADPLPLHIIADGHILGQGIAGTYRADLKKAGIHQGHHGFSIPIAEIGKLEGEYALQLVHAETLEEVKHKPFVVQPSHSMRFAGEMARVQDGHIVCRIAGTGTIGKRTIVLYHEDNPICNREIESKENIFDFSMPVPVGLMDGTPKLYKLGIVDYPNILAMQWFSVHPVQTPWQHLKESFRQPGFMRKPREAGHRYESLQYQLETIAAGKSKLTLEDLLTVHLAVIEGYENRKKFPAFTLPVHDKPRVSVIVPAYNQFALTYHCIASIALAFTQVGYEVILADDCSTDETAEAESIIGNLVVSRNPENLRFLRNCNRASELARGEFIVFLNNDTEVTSYWLDELIGKLDEDRQIGMTGSKLLNADGTLQEAGGIIWGDGQAWNAGRNANPYTPEYNYCREVDYLTGASMCVRGEVWEQVGRFSEELIPCYYEDTDLAFKVREAGFKTVYVPHSEVVHFEGQSHGRDITKGLKRYQVLNEKTFRMKWFHAFRHNGTAGTGIIPPERDRNIDQRVLVLDYATPMPNKDAGSYAAVQEMKMMIALGFKVTFVPINMAHFGKYTASLQKMGVEVLHAPFYTSVEDVLHRRLSEMDAVYITRYFVARKYLGIIRANSRAKVLFNNADLHFLREIRAALTGEQKEDKLRQALQTRDDELQVCREVDAVLCYNSTEQAVITSHILEVEKLHITPWILEKKRPGPPFEQRRGIAFLGGFNHPPNIEAVEYLAREIMPLLAKRRPDIHLSVYGSNMPKSFKEYETENIRMIGFTESLDEVFHTTRVFVVPLLSGAGIKGKVLESMAYGVPAVLSAVAAEGTGLTDEIGALFAKKPEEWVEAIIRLYDDREQWNKLAENAQLLARTQFSFEHCRQRFQDIFAGVGLYSTR